MSQGSDAEELAAVVNSLRRHLQRRERAGIRVTPQSAMSETSSATARDGNLLSGTENDLFSDSVATYQAGSLEELRAAIGDCRAANFARAEPISSSAWAIPGEADVRRRRAGAR
jgi:hypothetical protein